MFLSTDANKHSLSTLYGDGSHLWTGIDIQLRRPWLIVDYEMGQLTDDEELNLTSTALLASADDVLGLARKNVTILSALLLTPLTQRSGWTVDRLTGIWECADPMDSHVNIKIYAKEDGSHHIESLLRKTVEDAKNWKLLLEFP